MSGSRDERYGRLYRELQRPARAMVRRAFGSTFSDAEIEDVYGNAWLGTLRALRNRPELSEPELRKYVLTAVANHASKELRRRGRRPTSPLDNAPEVPDHHETPDERMTTKESSQVTREILSTLPERRRAVMMFRYGWGLDPHEVCGLVKGLSHRAYRKEVTAGVEEVTRKLRLVEQGGWCDDREPVLSAYAAGVADSDQRRQAEQHLAHCRPCNDFVAKLSGHLHEIGSTLALTGGVGDASVGDRVGGAIERTRQLFFDRGVSESADLAAGQVASSGTARGAGAASAGVLAKIAGASAVPKLVAACITGGAAATCVAAGVVPGIQLSGADKAAVSRQVAGGEDEAKPPTPPDTLPSQVGHDDPPPPPAEGDPGGDSGSEPAAPAPAPAPEPAPEPVAAPQAPASAQFDPVAAPPAASPPPDGAAPASGSQGAQEFGP